MISQTSFRAGLLRVSAASCVLMALSGCSAFRDVFGDPFNTDYREVKCPRADVTGQVGTLVRFSGPVHDAAHVAYRARLADLTGKCSVEAEGTTVTLTFTTHVRPGPAGAGASVDLPYFVAVLDPLDRTVSKEIFPNTIPITGGGAEVTATDEITQKIPLIEPRLAPGYHLLMGFQLTPEDLAYNRNH